MTAPTGTGSFREKELSDALGHALAQPGDQDARLIGAFGDQARPVTSPPPALTDRYGNPLTARFDGNVIVPPA